MDNLERICGRTIRIYCIAVGFSEEAVMRRTGLQLALLTLCIGYILSCQQVAFRDRHRIEEILASVKQATGGAAWDHVGEIINDETIQVGALTGQGTEFIDLKGGRSLLRYRFPSGVPPQGAQGFDGRQGWQQDADGHIQVSEDTSSQRGNADNAYATRHGYWNPNLGGAMVRLLPPTSDQGITYERIFILPSGGRGFTLWINTATHLIDRSEGTGEHPSTDHFSDYRWTDHVLLPFKISSESADATSSQIFTIKTRRMLPQIHDPDFSIPFERNYEISGSWPVVVPFLPNSKAILIKATIEDKGPFYIMFDTGASNVMDAGLAHQLGLRKERQVTGQGAAGSFPAGLTRINSIHIGNLNLHNQVFGVFPLPYFFLHGAVPVRAVLGYPVLRDLAIRIDYEHSQLTFYDGPTFEYSGEGTGIPCFFTPGVGPATVRGSIDGTSGAFDLDTGNQGSLALLKGFVIQHDLVHKLNAHLHGVAGESFGGAGMPMHAYFARVHTLDLGGVQVHDVVAQLSQDSSGGFAGPDAGYVGAGVLKQFTITFDSIHQKVFFQKNDAYGKPDVFNRTGIIGDPTPQGLKVLNVFEGSPAALAGIRQGDVISTINGHRSVDPEIPEDVFEQPEGTVLHFTVRRGGLNKSIELRLRDIL
jgi:hypothetical protein